MVEGSQGKQGRVTRMVRAPWSDSEGADGSGIHRFQFPSGSEAPTEWTRLVPISEFVPDLFAPLPSDQGNTNPPFSWYRFQMKTLVIYELGSMKIYFT